MVALVISQLIVVRLLEHAATQRVYFSPHRIIGKELLQDYQGLGCRHKFSGSSDLESMAGVKRRAHGESA